MSPSSSQRATSFTSLSLLPRSWVAAKDYVIWGLYSSYPSLGNQMEKKVENEVETAGISRDSRNLI